jgi:hypothetical protein
MPDQEDRETLQRAKEDEREGKAPSTAAGEFVRQEIHHVREGKHGARNAKQEIAIGLSKARRAGVKVPPPGRGAKARTRRSALSASRRQGKRRSPKRSRAARRALKREGKGAASRGALARQARGAARRRPSSARRATARRAARTRGAAGRRRGARKAAPKRRRRQARTA